MIAHLLPFLAVSALVIVTPGPDTALTVRNALFGGRPSGLATAVGVASGQAIWALFTATGVAALLRASQPAFAAIRVAGVAYLLFLGLGALIAVARSSGSHAGRAGAQGRPIVPRAAYRQGLFSNLSNPKMVVFFISLLPQFSRDGSFATLLALGAVFCTLTLAWLSGYAVVIAKAGDVLRRPRLRRALDAATGFALIGLGLRLATEHQ